MSYSLRPHGLQHARLPCTSLSPGVCSNSSPLSQWCYLTISFSATPFSFCLRSFPASGPFAMSRLFTSGGQSVGASASASVLPMNNQGWFLLGLTGWISLLVQWTLKSLLQHHSSKASILWHSAFFVVQLSHPHLLLGRKAMTNLNSVLKSRDITLPIKVCIVKAMVFPGAMYGCESRTIKKAENWYFHTVVLEKTLESPLDSKIKSVDLKGNQP